jgi:hypothetical protein
MISSIIDLNGFVDMPGSVYEETHLRGREKRADGMNG